jgi:hypothetical protein
MAYRFPLKKLVVWRAKINSDNNLLWFLNCLLRRDNLGAKFVTKVSSRYFICNLLLAALWLCQGEGEV